MKKAIALIVLAIFALLNPVQCADAQFSKTITVTAGTRIRVFSTRTLASSVLIQMITGGTGRGLIYNANPQDACSAGNKIAELAPASSTAPGGSYSDSAQNATMSAIDLAFICLDGSVNGDTILVSYRTAN